MAPQGGFAKGQLMSWAADRSQDQSLGHFRHDDQCGICSGLLELDERCVGLLGNPQSTTCWLSTRPFRYPGDGYIALNRAVDGWSPCRRPSGCLPCERSPEAATTHLECFELFTRTYARADALDRLWREASWRKPWPDAPHTVLPGDTHVTSKAVMTVAQAYGLPGFVRMPPEITQIIRDHSQSSLFWRLTAALDLAARFDDTPTSRLSSIPVRQVAEWERGCAPVQSHALTHLPIIRLTVDARGIRKLERLPAGEPRYMSRKSDNAVFIIEDEGRFDGVAALFKDGQARLELPETHPGFHTWDTPNPPLLLSPPDDPQAPQTCWYGSFGEPTRFSAIDLSSITGLTFFYNFGAISAIHAHTGSRPHAAIAPECWSRQVQETTTWNYVPIPANDRVLAIELRGVDEPLTRHCVLIRTRLAGDFSVGPWAKTLDTVHMFSDNPTTLIYGRRRPRGISALGAFPKSTLGDEDNPVFSDLSGPEHCPPRFRTGSSAVNFSAAPLGEVTVARVFYQKGRPFSRGLLLEYQSGAQRALGDCRVGVDPYETYETPRTLCASLLRVPGKYMAREVWGMRVHFTDESPCSCDDDDDGGGGDDWVVRRDFYEMTGTLRFWFTHELNALEVLQA